MGWKGRIVEVPLWAAGKLAPTRKELPAEPRDIFVLRNNDIGDLLVTTPLFEALRNRFPKTRIIAGIGGWNREVLLQNPFVDEIVEVNAPWTNKYVKDQSWRAVARYLFESDEVKHLAKRRFEAGIDVVGSHVGAALLMRMGIPFRIGVRGYRGGYSACQLYTRYNESTHVGRAALSMAELLGATELPPVRPQIYLTAQEIAAGEARWSARGEWPERKRLVLAIGGGFEQKCWPLSSFVELAEALGRAGEWEIMVLGGVQQKEEASRVASAARTGRSLAGATSLRESFAIVKAADLVVTNPSMIMHVAGAFSVQTYVVLGEYFVDARQHDAQWGYPQTCRSLGKGDGRTELYRPAEVAKLMLESVHAGGVR